MGQPPRKNEIAEIWVPHGMDEAAVRARCLACLAQGRYPVVYRSGGEDLAGRTGRLLARNK